MTSKIELHSTNIGFQFDYEKILQSYISLASILSGQILTALQWQEFFLCTISYLQSSILTAIIRNIPTELKFSEIIEEKRWTERIDVRDIDLSDVKIKEEAGKKGGNKKKGGKKEVQSGKSEEHKDEKIKEEEEKRLREWEEAWNKKFEAKEAAEDKAYCEAHGFHSKPKTQINLWIQVHHGKGSQDVQFCFKNVPVPRPKPPPLPPLKVEEPVEAPASVKGETKGKKGKKKK